MLAVPKAMEFLLLDAGYVFAFRRFIRSQANFSVGVVGSPSERERLKPLQDAVEATDRAINQFSKFRHFEDTKAWRAQSWASLKTLSILWIFSTATLS